MLLTSLDRRATPASMKKTLIILLIAVTTSCGQIRTTQNAAKNQSTAGSQEPTEDCAGAETAERTLRTVSFVPQFSASRIQSDYWPLLAEIGKRTNLCFKLDQRKSIPSFEEGLKSGSFDYAFMNPYHQVMVKETYQPIIRDKQRLLKGIIVVNNKSNVTSIEELGGQTFLLPAPNAFAASLLTRSYLDRSSINVTPKYVKTHQNVYRGVARDPDFIGGGVNNTFNRESDALRSNLSILLETKGYPAHPFSALEGLPPEEIRAVQDTWLNIAEDPTTRTLLNATQIKIPIKADYDQDYAQLANLGLGQYVQ